jgi:hypothetical protein
MTLLLRLPRRALLAGADLPHLARSAGDFRPAPEIEHRFGMRSHERRWALALLRAHPQIWLYRCDQLRAAGDVVMVDMSAPRALRACTVIELKQRTRLRAAPRHLQLAEHRLVALELARLGVLEPTASALALFGALDPAEAPRLARSA